MNLRTLHERLQAAADPTLAAWLHANRSRLLRTVAQFYTANASEGPTLTASGVTFGLSGADRRGGMVMVEVDSKLFDAAWETGDPENRIPPGGTKNTIGDRYSRFRQHLALTGDGATMPIHPSTIAPSWRDGVSFADGRHRFSVLRDMGKPTVVVQTHKSYAKKIARLYGPKLANPALENPTARTVYAIEISPRARSYRHAELFNRRAPANAPLVYVGQTGLTPAQRFREHKKGGQTASDVVKRFGLRLLKDTWGPFDSVEAAEKEEKRVAEELRRKGYFVFGGH